MGSYVGVPPQPVGQTPPVRIADTSTAIPNGTGNFQFFQGVALDGANIVFVGGAPSFDNEFGIGPAQLGVYKNIGAGLQVVADLNTLAPGTDFPFSGFGAVAMDPGSVVFVGFDFAGVAGLY